MFKKMRRLATFLFLAVTLASASPKRPFRTEEPDKDQALFDVDLFKSVETESTTSNVNDVVEEIDFGAFSWYDNENEDQVVIENAEERKRPERPTEGLFEFEFGSARPDRPSRPDDSSADSSQKRPWFDFPSNNNNRYNTSFPSEMRGKICLKDYQVRSSFLFRNEDRNNEWDKNRNTWNNDRNNWNTAGNSNRNQFQSNNNDNDDDIESVPYQVLERKYDYEVRQYETSKWVCTQETKDLDDDPYRNWRSRFANGREAMREVGKEEKRKDKENMFRTLFKYIIGVNKEAREIEMTRPVTTKRTRLVLNREKHEMCFWAG